jgi:hypothetical protein
MRLDALIDQVSLIVPMLSLSTRCRAASKPPGDLGETAAVAQLSTR